MLNLNQIHELLRKAPFQKKLDYMENMNDSMEDILWATIRQAKYTDSVESVIDDFLLTNIDPEEIAEEDQHYIIEFLTEVGVPKTAIFLALGKEVV